MVTSFTTNQCFPDLAPEEKQIQNLSFHFLSVSICDVVLMYYLFRACVLCFCYFLATHPTVAVALLKCTARLTSEKVDTARVQHLKVTRFN